VVTTLIVAPPNRRTVLTSSLPFRPNFADERMIFFFKRVVADVSASLVRARSLPAWQQGLSDAFLKDNRILSPTPDVEVYPIVPPKEVRFGGSTSGDVFSLDSDSSTFLLVLTLGLFSTGCPEFPSTCPQSSPLVLSPFRIRQSLLGG